ncbi:tol-pal system protein YbgF [Desulfuromusa kysingii]|uniref:Tol-pal system protein YbgF n=1 Tax=Desulfuromusa kysingii TaxID=37625 RepID=A0A1H4DES1_9BACT|nr:tol-pal system protein YbgF [Desulfuromusa kysingii]SEA70752.1 tol-pal system protein YbgF [Desulfuromusa kysingii]
MRFIFILLSLLLLSGCVPPSQNQLRMEKDLAEMKRRLAQLEVRTVETSQAKIAGGDTQQRQAAELLAGVDNLRVEFQSVNGRMDDLGQENRALANELQLIKDDMGLQLTSLTNRVAELEGQALTQQTQSAQQQPEQNLKPEPTAEQLYQDALDAIRNQDKYSAGRKMLESFVSKYPKHELYINALYWIGEAYYGEKQYESAILQFQDVISKYASHPKAAAAMLKQALSFDALGDKENARTTMQKVMAEYPDSPQATTAKSYLEKG